MGTLAIWYLPCLPHFPITLSHSFHIPVLLPPPLRTLPHHHPYSFGNGGEHPWLGKHGANRGLWEGVAHPLRALFAGDSK